LSTRKTLGKALNHTYLTVLKTLLIISCASIIPGACDVAPFARLRDVIQIAVQHKYKSTIERRYRQPCMQLVAPRDRRPGKESKASLLKLRLFETIEQVWELVFFTCLQLSKKYKKAGG
jgi:hypothetical protein